MTENDEVDWDASGHNLYNAVKVDQLRWILEEVNPWRGKRAGQSCVRVAIRVAWRLLSIFAVYMRARDEVSLLRNGLSPDSSRRSVSSGCEIDMGQQRRSAYLAFNSLPYHSAGYATRSHGLASGLRHLGFDIAVVTRLGYPNVFRSQRNTAAHDEILDGVPYLRLGCKRGALRWLSTRDYLRANIAATLHAARTHNAGIIHGASNFITGLTAVHVARALGVRSVYEVRGLWEITAASRDPSYASTLHYAQAVRLETDACLAADKVIAITGALKEELIRRSVPAEKIVVVPNGVDTERFRPSPRNTELAERLGIAETDIIVGYVGSIVDYEGLDDLLYATRMCVDKGMSTPRLLIVGDGVVISDLKALAKSLNLQNHVIFTGRVPHEEVENYYSLIDIAPFPRKPMPVCEMVSPLKPFEAMAMAKCVIVSSVAALSEIVDDRPVGLIHEKGSVTSLAERLETAIGDKGLRDRLGANAREFVVAERDWSVLAQSVATVYEELAPDVKEQRTEVTF